MFNWIYKNDMSLIYAVLPIINLCLSSVIYFRYVYVGYYNKIMSFQL